MKKALYLVIIISGVFVLSISCDLNKLDSPEGLVGTWEITEKPDGEPHHIFIFTDTDEYEIRDDENVVFESGSMWDITDNSFEYEIEVQTKSPNIIGGKNYAEFSISNDNLEITFYDDDTKTEKFISFTAKRK